MKQKICPICKRIIDDKKDRWVHVEDYNKGKKEGEQDCHLDCWRNWDKFRVHNAMNEAMINVKKMMPSMIQAVKENI